MGVYVVKQGQPWWSGLANTLAGHFLDQMFKRDDAYRQKKQNAANLNAFADEAFAEDTPSPNSNTFFGNMGSSSGNITPPSYTPITVDSMSMTSPATGLDSNIGSGVVTTLPPNNVNLSAPTQSSTQNLPAKRPMSRAERVVRAGRHLNSADPQWLIKMAMENDLKNDANFRNAQRVSQAVGEFPTTGNGNDQFAYLSKVLPYFGSQAAPLASIYGTTHPGHQMNVVDTGDRKSVVTLDKFGGQVSNPMNLQQGLNPDKHEANQVKLQTAAMRSSGSRGAAPRNSSAASGSGINKARALELVQEAVASNKITASDGQQLAARLSKAKVSSIPEAAWRKLCNL